MFSFPLGDFALLILFWCGAPLTWLGITLTCLRRKKKGYALLLTLLFVISYGLVLVGLRADRFLLEVEIRDVSGHPLSDVSVEYSTWPDSQRIGRFSRKIKGISTTDSAGRVFIKSHHAHSMSLNLRHDDLAPSRIEFRAAGRGHTHQLFPSPNLRFIEPAEPPPNVGLTKGSWSIPEAPLIKLVVAIK